MFAGGTARLLVGNDGEAPLELTVEPWADAYRIPPGQTWAVVTHSSAGGGSWPGAVRLDEPFQVGHRPDAVTVWANGSCFHLSELEGDAIDAADWDCPAQGAECEDGTGRRPVSRQAAPVSVHSRRAAAERLAARAVRGEFEPTRRMWEARKAAFRGET